MRILISGNSFSDSFARNIATTAQSMGHEVFGIDDSPAHRHLNVYWLSFWSVLPKIIPYLEDRRHSALLNLTEELQPDLLLITHGNIPPAVIERARHASSAKIISWYPDALVNLGRQYLLASPFDAWFFKDPYMVDVFKAKLGINAHYLPQACNSLWHRKVELNEADQRKYECDLCTAANMYYYRARLLEAFKNYNLKIWGNNYPNWIKSPARAHYQFIYVAELEKAKAFNCAKIVLNTMHFGEILGVNCRLFEIAGCGAFQIAEWKPALPGLFEPEREIVTFQTRKELKDKVDYYLAHPEERQTIADRSYARACREHTYENRLHKMFHILGLTAEGTCPAARFQTLSSV
jgi:spore maturation protein CgeB